MTTVTTQLSRAKSSRIANNLKEESFDFIEKIIVAERPAKVTEGWFLAPKGSEELDYYSVKEMWVKTATLYGASALYFRPCSGMSPRYFRDSVMGKYSCLEEIDSFEMENEDDFEQIRVLRHKHTGECYLLGISRNGDDEFLMFEGKNAQEEAMEAFDTKKINLEEFSN